MIKTTELQFKKAIAKLNAQQSKAVQQTEGPVLVLAGPGTGKTEVLAVRIGYILEQQPINPYNILCLTFSNAGVTAMRKRLKELIGETAEQVEISTFHAFSNKLIMKNAADQLKGKSLITDAQRSMLIEKLIVDHLAPEDPTALKPASGKKISTLAGIFATLKQEGLTREEIIAHAHYCIENILPYEKEYLRQNNELNADGRKLRDKILHFSDKISAMYEAYCNELENRDKIEFEDMLAEAIILLQSNPQLLASQRENYLYILVDEFQDTNKKQIALLDLLVSGNMEPNLFVVGDDDQCIYRFQGASSLNFDWMRKKFHGNLQTIVLDTNYRSTAVLLQEAFGLIRRNANRQPEKEQALIAGNSRYEEMDPILPTFRSYENAEQEACAIAKQIAEQLNNGKKAEEIAILARRHYDLEPIKKWLPLYNIAWQSNQNTSNLLNGLYGQTLFYLLLFIKNQDNIGYNAAGFFTQLMLLKSNANGAALVKAFLKSRNEKNYNLYEWLKHQPHEIEYFKEMVESIDELLSVRDQQVNERMLDLMDTAVWCGLGIDLLEEEKRSWRAFVQSFLETDKYKTLSSLGDLLWYHDQQKITIKVESNEQTLDDDAVVLSTIHGSKGLQYDTVYVIACHNKNWEDRDDRGSVKVPDLLNRYISPEADSEDDMRKLIYVACTRAETELHVSMHRRNASDKEISMTTLLNGFGLHSNVELEIVEEFELPEIVCDNYSVKVDEELMKLIKQKVESFEISPTSTGTWCKCQNEFFFTQVLKIGGFFNEAASFGTVVHNVLQGYASNPNRDLIPGLINQLIDQEINKQKHLFHSTHIDKYKRYAQWLIPHYLSSNPITSTPEHIEAELHAVIDGDVKIKGKLDRIDVDGDLIKVVDYKTGRYKETLKPFVSIEEPGTQYWRQAMIYSMLIRENFNKNSSISFEFHYPEIEQGIYSFHEPEQEGFNNWLKEIWESTKSLTFNQACDDPGCVYCAAKLM